MYGPPPVGKLDRLRLEGSASMYPAFGWSGGSGPRWISTRISPAKTLGFEEPFFEPGLGCGGRPPRHQDDRLADVGETSFGWGDRAALTPPAPHDASSQTAWCRAERPKRSGSVCWPRRRRWRQRERLQSWGR